MFDFPVANRQMTISTPLLGDDALLLMELTGTEQISRLYEFQVVLEAARSSAPKFEELLGQPASLKVGISVDYFRYFHGVFTEVTQLDTDFDSVRFRAVLSPQLWLLQKRTQCRIFQQQTVPQILATVLGDIDTRFELIGEYPSRDYCVQYRESDFHFASRLMEEEGVFYAFEHSADRHQMVLYDSNESLVDLPDPHTIEFDRVEGGEREQMRIALWEKTQRIATTKFTLRDHCFELQELSLETNQGIKPDAEVGTIKHTLQGPVELEQYDYPGQFAQRFDGVAPGGADRAGDLQKISEDGERTVKLRAQEEASLSLEIKGESDCVHFTPGRLFELTEHGDGDGKYLLAKIEHVAKMNTQLRATEDPEQMEYSNRFVCTPFAIPFRPARVHRKPQITGVQSATVCTPEGKETFIDKYGRIKVQFRWDRQGAFDADSSCWVRVGQVWAGPRWGAFFWPRGGHEVVVIFEEGDPDRPLVIGNTYNSTNMPPFPVPDKFSLCGIKSKSYGGDPLDNFNCVIFHDTKGDEHLQLHSETYENITCEAEKVNFVPGTNFRMRGSLPFGSGGGGGLGHAMDEYSSVMGGTTTISFGDQQTHCYSSKLNLTADWTACLQRGMKLSGGDSGPLLAALLGYSGQVNLDMASRANIMYGEMLTVNRGPVYRVNEPDFFMAPPADTPPFTAVIWKVVQALTAVMLILDFLMNLVVRIIYAVDHDNGKTPANFSNNAYLDKIGWWHKWVMPRLVGVLVEIEKTYALITIAEEDVDMSAKGLATTLALGTRLNEPAAAACEGYVAKVKDWLKRQVRPALGNYPEHGTHLIEKGAYVIDSRKTVELRSSHPTEPTDIFLSAMGAGSGAPLGGNVLIAGTATSCMSAGPASMTCDNNELEAPKIGIDGSAAGTVELTAGPPEVGPTIKLDGPEEAIELSVAGSKIRITATDITLSIGESTIELLPALIKLGTAAGSVSINDESVSIEGTSVEIDAAMECTVSASGDVAMAAAMVSLNS